MSTTRGTLTNSVDSTPSLHNYTGGSSLYDYSKTPFAVSGLQVQALVSGLLHSRIQPTRLLTDLGLRRAAKDSSSVLLRDHVLLDPAYTATNGSTAVSGHTP
jgi:hypothetical protein